MTSRAGTYNSYSASDCKGTVTQLTSYNCETDGSGWYNAANCAGNTAITNYMGDNGVRYTWNSAASTAIAAAAVFASVVAYAL